MQTLIRDRSVEGDRQIEALRPLITELEAKVSGILLEHTNVMVQRDASSQTYTTDLGMKTNQARAIQEAPASQPHIVLEAGAIASPQPRGTTRNVTVAAVLGLVLGVAAAFGWEYAQSRQKSKKDCRSTRTEILS